VASLLTLIGSARNRVAARADTGLALVGLGAGIAVVASCPLGGQRATATVGIWLLSILRRLLPVFLVISSLGQCRLPLLLESGHSTKTDLRNPADFQRFTALAATVRNCRFPNSRVSAGRGGPRSLAKLEDSSATREAGKAPSARPVRSGVNCARWVG
jgi:hypothetical protein